MIGLEEAIKLISPATEGAAYIKIRDEHGQEAAHNQAEMAKILAVEYMEKQIAKPPAQVEDDDELCVRYECPACGSFLAQRPKGERMNIKRLLRFCECGQRISWEVEK